MLSPINQPGANSTARTVDDLKGKKIGVTTAGSMTRWLVDEGARVETGQPIAEIETDKTTIEMEALVAGQLVEIVAQAGSEIAIGEVIAYLE